MSWERPEWVRELRTFLNDTIIDFIERDGSEDDITDMVKDAALAVVCAHYGHYVENDMCGGFEHRYCSICGKHQGGAPLGDQALISHTPATFLVIGAPPHGYERPVS